MQYTWYKNYIWNKICFSYLFRSMMIQSILHIFDDAIITLPLFFYPLKDRTPCVSECCYDTILILTKSGNTAFYYQRSLMDIGCVGIIETRGLFLFDDYLRFPVTGYLFTSLLSISFLTVWRLETLEMSSNTRNIARHRARMRVCAFH